MSNLNEVLEFIKNSDLQECNKIKNAVSIRKSELAYDAKLSFRVGDMVGIDHKKINQWRRMQSLKNTYLKRPDLIDRSNLSEDEIEIIDAIKNDPE